MATTTGQSGRQHDASPLQPEEFEVVLLSCPEETGYAVLVPALPGCASQGEDWDEALEWVQDAIETFLDFAKRPEVGADEKDRLITEWTKLGYLVETATVRANV